MADNKHEDIDLAAERLSYAMQIAHSAMEAVSCSSLCRFSSVEIELAKVILEEAGRASVATTMQKHAEANLNALEQSLAMSEAFKTLNVLEKP